jgi:DMSO/TMAO reductase YedYZ heme-binding membrane subunit
MNFWIKNKIWLILALILVSISLLIFTFDSRLSLRFSVYAGMVSLILTLFPANIVTNLSPSLKKIMLKLLSFRRDFGILSGILFLTHALTAWYLFGGLELNFLFGFNILSGFLAVLVFVLLLATSSQWSRKVLKKHWKRIHLLVWITPPLIMSHSFLSGTLYSNSASLLAAIGFGSLILLAIYQLFRKKWQHFALILVGYAITLIILTVIYPDSLKLIQ